MMMRLMNMMWIPVDIKECSLDLDDCSEFATCENTEGSFQCVCLEGYQGNGTQCTGQSLSVCSSYT